LEGLIQNWQPENFAGVNALLAKYGTFEPSVKVINRFLEQAQLALRTLPESAGRSGLSELADFLAQQTGALAVQ
jgi:geranylgeranyl pyrophosphate synthase